MVKLEISNRACGIRPCNGCIKVKCTSCYLQELWSWIALKMRLFKTVFKVQFKKISQQTEWIWFSFVQNQIYLCACLILATCEGQVSLGISWYQETFLWFQWCLPSLRFHSLTETCFFSPPMSWNCSQTFKAPVLTTCLICLWSSPGSSCWLYVPENDLWGKQAVV